MRITPKKRQRFDRLLEQVLGDLPQELHKLFDEIPLVVEDRPSPAMLQKLKLSRGKYLCGVHSGIPLTHRSVRHSGTLPTVITIYREGIYLAAGKQGSPPDDDELGAQIRFTVLHEIGHHFGMTEDDLRAHGYG